MLSRKYNPLSESTEEIKVIFVIMDPPEKGSPFEPGTNVSLSLSLSFHFCPLLVHITQLLSMKYTYSIIAAATRRDTTRCDTGKENGVEATRLNPDKGLDGIASFNCILSPWLFIVQYLRTEKKGRSGRNGPPIH